MKLIVGLGNPGDAYSLTRHNLGFMALDNYLGDVSWQDKFQGKIYSTKLENEKIFYLKPSTYMNLSGISVKNVMDFYKISANDILIIHDDLDLEFGKIRIKKNSSSGGHNGIKSIINSVGTQDFTRLKIGISHSSSSDTKDYVLAKFSKSELEILNNLFPIINNIIDDFIHNKNINELMSDYNGGNHGLSK